MGGSDPARDLARLGIRWVIGNRDFVPLFRRDIQNGTARVALRSNDLRVLEILLPPTPQPPAPPVQPD